MIGHNKYIKFNRLGNIPGAAKSAARFLLTGRVVSLSAAGGESFGS